MRHGKSFNHLGRKAPHRQAMLSNMASSLIQNKRITTTVAKAKALRRYVEPLLTRAKNDTTQSRRVVFSYLQDKQSVQVLFDEVAAKIADRPGGYTRIIKLADTRLGDSSEMCIMELVDYNDLLLTDSDTGKKKTRRSRRGGGKGKSSEGEVTAQESKSTKAKGADKKEETKAEADVEAKKEAKAEAKEDKEPKAEAKAQDSAEAASEGKDENKKEDSSDEEKKDNE